MTLGTTFKESLTQILLRLFFFPPGFFKERQSILLSKALSSSLVFLSQQNRGLVNFQSVQFLVLLFFFFFQIYERKKFPTRSQLQRITHILFFFLFKVAIARGGG